MNTNKTTILMTDLKTLISDAIEKFREPITEEIIKKMNNNVCTVTFDNGRTVKTDIIPDKLPKDMHFMCNEYGLNIELMRAINSGNMKDVKEVIDDNFPSWFIMMTMKDCISYISDNEFGSDFGNLYQNTLRGHFPTTYTLLHYIIISVKKFNYDELSDEIEALEDADHPVDRKKLKELVDVVNKYAEAGQTKLFERAWKSLKQFLFNNIPNSIVMF